MRQKDGCPNFSIFERWESGLQPRDSMFSTTSAVTHVLALRPGHHRAGECFADTFVEVQKIMS